MLYQTKPVNLIKRKKELSNRLIQMLLEDHKQFFFFFWIGRYTFIQYTIKKIKVSL